MERSVHPSISCSAGMLHPLWGIRVFLRGLPVYSGVARSQVSPTQKSAVLTCSPGFLTVENHWDTGSPLPNSSVCDVSGMIFALLPFSGKETEGSEEFALCEFPTCLIPTDKSLERSLLRWWNSKGGGTRKEKQQNPRCAEESGCALHQKARMLQTK